LDEKQSFKTSGIRSLIERTDEASTANAGNLFHSLTEETLSQLQPTSSNFQFQLVTSETISANNIQFIFPMNLFVHWRHIHRDLGKTKHFCATTFQFTTCRSKTCEVLEK